MKVELSELSDQQRRVYEHLKSGKGLSNLIALASLGVGSLSSRISELRRMGVVISSSTRTDPVNGRKYSVYRMADITTPAQKS